jgi:hypothetical protein
MLSLGHMWVEGMVPFSAELHKEYSCEISLQKLALQHLLFLFFATACEVRSPVYKPFSWHV